MREKGLKLFVSILLLNSLLYGELTKTEVSMLYVSILNRASEGSGNQYWQNKSTISEAATAILNTSDAKEYFGSNLDTNQAFIEWIYKNTLNKTIEDDKAGIDYWVGLLNNGVSRGDVVASLVNAAMDPKNAGKAQNQFKNRVEVSNYMAENVYDVPSDYKTSTSFSHGLSVNDDYSSVSLAKNSINTLNNNRSSNIKPIVHAGEDKTITVNQTVTINGSASDSDGTIVSYEWKKGTEVLGTTATLIYIPTEVGIDTLTLTVTDDDGATASDSIKIIVEQEIIIDTPSIKK